MKRKSNVPNRFRQLFRQLPGSYHKHHIVQSEDSHTPNQFGLFPFVLQLHKRSLCSASPGSLPGYVPFWFLVLNLSIYAFVISKSTNNYYDLVLESSRAKAADVDVSKSVSSCVDTPGFRMNDIGNIMLCSVINNIMWVFGTNQIHATWWLSLIRFKILYL